MQHEANAALRKAQTLAEQRREEYKKVLSSSSRSQEEQGNPGNKQLDRKRRLEEEALQKVRSQPPGNLLDSKILSLCSGQAEEAQDQYQSCRADAGVRRMDLANAKRTVLTQLRETIFQCDLTLKAVRSSTKPSTLFRTMTPPIRPPRQTHSRRVLLLEHDIHTCSASPKMCFSQP